MTTAADCEGRDCIGKQKSWFYFSFSGFPKGAYLTFIIKNISILKNLVIMRYKPYLVSSEEVRN